MEQRRLSCFSKVSIVGIGNVGSTIAYALLLNRVGSSLSLVDVNGEKARGVALDLRHCMQFLDVTDIVGGDSFELVSDADVVIITAGSAQKPGQSRTDLLQANVSVFKKIIPEIVRNNKNCILLVVTNPLDVMTYVAWRLSGFSSCSVFGTGTVLDTARLRYAIGQYTNISPKDVVAYVLGEHGESEFAWWSAASIAGIPLNQFPGYTQALCDDLLLQTKQAAELIIATRGFTSSAIALVVVKIVRALLLNQPRVFSVSRLVHDTMGIDDVCLSLPTVIRRGGICDLLTVAFDAREQQQFEESAYKIKADIARACAYLS